MNRKRVIVLFIAFVFVVFSVYFMIRTTKKPFDDSKHYSNQLQLSTSVEGNTEVFKYIDENGNITYAEDKGYAYVVKIHDDSGLVIREDYYDENGNYSYLPSGYCSVAIEENWPERKYVFLDENSNPVTISDNYSVKVRSYVSREQKDYTERYYDYDLNPVKCRSGYYGITYIYDNPTQFKYIYLDQNGNQAKNPLGYSVVVKQLYDDGKVKTEQYYEQNEVPVLTSLGYYGIYIEYDANGKRSLVTSLNNNGEPMINAEGYVSARYFYRENGTLEKTVYFDEFGNPCKSKDGSYGMYYDGEVKYYLTKSGYKYMSVDSMLNNYPYLVIVAATIVCVLLLIIPKKYKIWLLTVYFVFILFETILGRETRATVIRINPLESYRGFFSNQGTCLEILNNIWLFVPYGMGIKSLLNNKKVILMLFLVPVGIELVQLIFRIGTFETADIINNVLGELIGLFLCIGLKNINRKELKN